MKLSLYQVDAFTSRLFGGNPAAVVLLDAWLDDEILQAIAAENNLSETAFVIPGPERAAGGVRECPLRWFTPALEVDLCGHATVAAAHVLFRHHFPDRDTISFTTRSGTLVVTRTDGRIALDFPSRPGKPVPVDDAVVAALGMTPREAYLARDLLLILDSEEDVRAFRPDFQRIASLDVFAVILSAPGDTVDFVSRFFAPAAGVPEDPVTGSAHCTLIPYWAERLGKKVMTARQLSARGGDIHCEMRNDRVIIAGGAVEYLVGEIEV